MAKEIKENLGNYDTVVQILRTAVDEFFTYLGTTKDDPEARAAWMTKMCSTLGDLFLDGSKQYEAVEVWNAPGKIDAYLADLYPFPTTDPKERMRWFFVVFFNEINELHAFASTPGVLDEQWKPSGARLFQRFAMMLLGIPLDESADATEESSTVEVQESVKLSGRQRAMLENWKDYP
jgi:hypothetical protein